MAARFALAWRLHRAEIVAVAIAALGLSAVLLFTAQALDRIVAACRAATEVVAPCGGLNEFGTIYDNDIQTRIAMIGPLVGALPFVAGVLLGAPLVAHELEQGTAQVSWSLARSRARWLVIRFLPLVAIGLVVLVIPAVAGEILERSLRPVIDPAASFEHYGTRGPLLVIRFLPAVAIAAVIGAVVGRQLLALLVAGAVVGGLAFGLTLVTPLWVEPEEQAAAEPSLETVGNLFAYVRYRDPGGNWISQEEAFAHMSFEGEEPDPNAPEEVFFVIPGERYPEVVARESAALLATGLVAGGLLLLTVRRRRPG